MTTLINGKEIAQNLRNDLKNEIENLRNKTGKISAENFVTEMLSKGIKFLETSPNRFRLVTHYGITSDDISKTLIEFKKYLNLNR